MTIYINVKSLSKRKPVIDKFPLEIPEETSSANSLIEFVVRQNVADYNKLPTKTRILPYLTNEEIANGEAIGKIGFGERKNENNQNPDDAVKNALQCFSDGIYRVFVNENEIFSDKNFTIKDGDEVTFVRLTMLAGRLM